DGVRGPARALEGREDLAQEVVGGPEGRAIQQARALAQGLVRGPRGVATDLVHQGDRRERAEQWAELLVGGAERGEELRRGGVLVRGVRVHEQEPRTCRRRRDVLQELAARAF